MMICAILRVDERVLVDVEYWRYCVRVDVHSGGISVADIGVVTVSHLSAKPSTVRRAVVSSARDCELPLPSSDEE